ncbi:MAG: DGQHR domain-containing protein [Pseudomonadota bacterium]
MKINILKITQPIGTFYIGVIPAKILIETAYVRQREYDPVTQKPGGGVQRIENMPRVNEIAEYCSDTDATFPTPIIIAVDNDSNTHLVDDKEFVFDEKSFFGEIIDGQHRIKGIEKSKKSENFELPVILMFNLNEEEKAYVFSIINSKQTKVPMSLIYDLFDVIATRCPQKTCHEIARLMNSSEDSPFYKKLKMLGKKEDEYAFLSQGTFVKYLMKLISKKPDDDLRKIKSKDKLIDDNSLPFRRYFLDNKDEVIYKILVNLFYAIKNTFPEEWDSNRHILSKTLGYGAVLRSFPHLYKCGSRSKDLSYDFFKIIFDKMNHYLDENSIELTSDYFPSNEQEMKKLSNIIIKMCD